MNYQHRGFTLIEMALVVLIIGILASMALPTYRDNTEKARLVELLLQVDAMRTAMTSSYESGDRSMLSLKVSKLDTIKDQIPNLPLPDNFTYPPFEMLMLSTSQQFGPFGGTPRPYLVINAKNTKDVDAVRTLHNFSQIYPQDRQAWWAPSTVMVIPLLDDAILGITGSSQPTNSGALPGSSSSTSSSLTSSTSSSSSSTGSGTASSQGNGGASSTTVASQGSSTGSNSAASSSSSGTSSPPVSPPCVHPGNGHAYGRCRHH